MFLLCEGNSCGAGAEGKDSGHGRIKVCFDNEKREKKEGKKKRKVNISFLMIFEIGFRRKSSQCVEIH